MPNRQVSDIFGLFDENTLTSRAHPSAQIGGGGGYEIPNIPESKTRCGFGFERIKIRENTLVAFLA
jgi:hypothetical protein